MSHCKISQFEVFHQKLRFTPPQQLDAIVPDFKANFWHNLINWRLLNLLLCLPPESGRDTRESSTDSPILIRLHKAFELALQNPPIFDVGDNFDGQHNEEGLESSNQNIGRIGQHSLPVFLRSIPSPDSH